MTSLSRRSFLRLACATLGALAARPWLAGCSRPAAFPTATPTPRPSITPTPPPTSTLTPLPSPTPDRSLIDLHRENANNFLVRIPFNQTQDYAEFRLRLITTVLPGWDFSSNQWILLGLRVLAPGAVWTLTERNSAWEYAIKIARADAPQKDFTLYGSLHQGQRRTTWSLAADGIDATGLESGQHIYCQQVVMAQSLDIYDPTDKSTVIGSTDITHTFDPTDQVMVRHAHAYHPGYQLYSAFSAMLPVTNGDGMGIDRVQSGQKPAYTPVQDGSAQFIGAFSSLCRGWHSAAHRYRINMLLPDGGPAGAPWDADSQARSVQGLWLQDYLEDPTKAKFYLSWISNQYIHRITAQAASHRQRYYVDLR
jgi:hypothetical protein